MGLKDLFWKTEIPTNQETGAAEDQSGGWPSGGEEDILTPPGKAASSPASTTSVTAADFPTIYAQMSVAGDPKTDALLAAYAGLASMEEASRRVAVQAVLTGMQAQAPVILQTLEKRVGLLKFLVQEERKKIDKNAQQRVAEITQNQTATDAEIAKLEKQIADLRASLAELRKAADRADQDEEKTTNAFEVRVEVETQRLNGLLVFLKGMTSQPKGK